MYPPDIIIMAHIKIFVNKENKYFYMCSGGLTGKKCRYGDVPASFVFAFLLIGVIAYVNLVCYALGGRTLFIDGEENKITNTLRNTLMSCTSIYLNFLDCHGVSLHVCTG